ncbi:hypothetical protein ACIQAC_28185 [Streptomyces sp. NPDC088387]|uniref:hypothetical protein n=1 Tax=Streptomyces sp. NPDC088387 TaxID=3365859 RepID=UPI00381A39D3
MNAHHSRGRRDFLRAATAVAATAALAETQLTGTATAAGHHHGTDGRPDGTDRPHDRRSTAALVERIHRAHGGLRLWRDARHIKADVTYGGPFWAFKGVPAFVGTDHVVADIHRQHIRLTQPSGRVIEFDKSRDLVTVTEPGGRLERLRHPRATFDGYTGESRWSVAQAGYFRAYATWLYLVEAFVLTHPGVRITEIEPWHENGRTWRVLNVTFPAGIDTHSRDQQYYFDADAHLVRLDYAPEINGSAPTAHYQPRRAAFDGAVITTRHEIFGRNADNTPDRSLVRISLDVANASVH